MFETFPKMFKQATFETWLFKRFLSSVWNMFETRLFLSNPLLFSTNGFVTFQMNLLTETFYKLAVLLLLTVSLWLIISVFFLIGVFNSLLVIFIENSIV